MEKLCQLFTSGRLKLADYEAQILGLVYANANELGPAAVCKFVDEFSPNIIVMMICAIIMCYGQGAIDTGLNNFVSLHYEARHMNWLHCCWGLGVTISPLIMSAFLSEELSSWRLGYRVVAMLQLSITVIIALSIKRWDKVEKSIVSEEKTENTQSAKLFDLLKIKGVLTSILSMGLYCGMEFSMGTWGATYAVNTFAIAPDEAAKWISLYFGGIMVSRIIAGFLSEKLSDDALVTGGMALAAVGMVVLLLPIGKTALVGLLLIGMGYGPVFPSVLHSVPSRFGQDYSADITGYQICLQAGQCRTKGCHRIGKACLMQGNDVHIALA